VAEGKEHDNICQVKCLWNRLTRLVGALKFVPNMAAALKNTVLVLKNGLQSQVMGGKSRKRPQKLDLNHEHRVKWEIPDEI
jgi:hypothetical protein